ncbi:MAG TPA: hypothetical protein VI685_11750 [Candidatus Angelobacter sp.]
MDGQIYTTIAAAYNDSTNCKSTILVPPGYTETLSATLSLNRSDTVIRFLGSAAITQGPFQVVVPSGKNNVSIVSDLIGTVNANGGISVTFKGFSGSGAAIQVGSSSADTANFYLKGIYVELAHAQNSAVGISLTRVHQFILDSLQVGVGSSTASNLTAILLNGAGDSTHNYFTGIGEINMPVISMGANSNYSIGIQAINQVTDTLVIGGTVELDSTATSSQYPLGTRCFDVDGTSGPGSELFFYSPNCEAAVNALSVEGNAKTVGDVRRDSGVGTLTTLASGTSGNKIRFVNATGGTVVDHGSNNSVEFPSNDQVHSDLWQIMANSGAWAVSYVPTGKDPIFFNSSNTFINALTGGVVFNEGSGSAVQFFNGGTTQVGLIDSSGNASFSGNLTVNGTKLFKIDHPLDPLNKYLSHAAIESSEMKDMYDGIVLLDEKGEADIKLPDWFQALNKDFRYQLTCIGGSAPIYVAQEIQDNRFRIAGGRPGLKVSWQVTGIRHDASAEANRFSVEEEKPAKERGHYLFAGFEKANQSLEKPSTQK